jgi:hypothetical protein
MTRHAWLRASLLVVAAVGILVLGVVPPALATPGASYGNYMWYKPGTQPTNGTLRAYTGYHQALSMTAGSGSGVNWNNPCVPNAGRLPDGWYNTYNGHHVDHKNDLIKGRVWGLSDKAKAGCQTRTALFIHTEKTADNGQYCPTNDDDPYCWENANDYLSIGCVKISYPNNGFPNSIGSLHTWWHGGAGGLNSTYYSQILWVGASSPPL